MATVTKPIALDESLNTTELSSRNVADVLAQELSAVATAIGGIAVPSADHVSYDNSVSGLSATDVQNALDEIVSDIPTVNNGTLTIQQNGTSKGSFTANSASNVNVNIETPTADKKTATDQFNTADGGLLSKCQINLVPVQSGSGDPSPDNVRPISGHTEVDLFNNGQNRWKGETYSYGGITYTYNDGEYTMSGSTAYNINYECLLDEELPIGTYAVCGFNESAISGVTLRLKLKNGTVGYDLALSSANASQTVTVSSPIVSVIIRVSNTTFSGTEKFKPMISSGSSVPTEWTPYLGHLYQVQIGSTVYGGNDDIVNGNAKSTYKLIDMGDLTYNYNSTDNIFGTSVISDMADYDTSRIQLACEVFKALKPKGTDIKNEPDNCIAFNNGSLKFLRIKCTSYTDGSALKTALTGYKLAYEVNNPTDITHDSTQIETLAGQNNLSTPLSGQSIETNGVEYKELFTFADVKEYVDKKIPDAPTTDGTYTLQAVVSGGVPTYSWV